MQQASQNQDGPKIEELSLAIHTCQTAIDRLFDELEEVSNEFDSRSAVFEEQLQKLTSDLADGNS
jgi:ATP-binding cassette subfamily F protein 3